MSATTEDDLPAHLREIARQLDIHAQSYHILAINRRAFAEMSGTILAAAKRLEASLAIPVGEGLPELFPGDWKLCYVEDNEAWFTTQELSKQWGDDWNDAPYEHNAGTPYHSRPLQKEPQWELLKLMFSGDFERPCDGVANSRYSVDMINAGQVAWLRTQSYSAVPIAIRAGVDVVRFAALVRAAGGDVYIPLVALSPPSTRPGPKE